MSQFFNRRQTVLTILGCIAFALSASAAKATSVFVTPPGSSIGGNAVNAKATFSQSGNVLTITLQNFQPNPLEVVQTISGLRFTVATAGGTLTSSSGDHITVNSGGSFSDNGFYATDWILTSSAGNYFLNGLGSNGPDEEIIGPPGGGTYSAANGSIANNGPHNPFLNQTATFTLTIPGLPANAVISNVIFQFGTGNDSVPGVPSAPVPEPATMLLLGTGLLGLAGGIRHRRRSGK